MLLHENNDYNEKDPKQQKYNIWLKNTILVINNENIKSDRNLFNTVRPANQNTFFWPYL